MSNEEFNYEKSISAMVIRFIDGLEFLNEDEKANWLELGLSYKSDIDELYRIYDYINGEEKEFIDSKKIIKIHKDYKVLEVIIRDNTLKIHIKDVKKILAGIIDILEDILPIGTIIELKPQFIESILGSKNLKEAPKFIIIRRFLRIEDSLTYFPYEAVPYPVGELNDGKNIHLTFKAIDKIVYKGFSDKVDLAYICVMKSELILKKNMYSISFSNTKEREGHINTTPSL